MGLGVLTGKKMEGGGLEFVVMADDVVGQGNKVFDGEPK